MKFKSNLFLTSTILFALISTSCTSAKNASIIATSVAQTVQAQNAQPTQVTDTPVPLETQTPVAGTGTPVTTPAVTAPAIQPTSSGGNGLNCSIVANFVSETVPDGTIENPGAVFIKTWNIQNNGTCTWDTTWKIAYDKGDLMGGGYVYNFPQVVAPGQTVPISISFTAPLDQGTYAGYWLLESPNCPNCTVFGVGQYNVPLSVNINVNSGTPGSGTATVYGITSVTYAYGTSNQRNSATPGVDAGTCTGGANIFLTTWATISSSEPLTIKYYWRQSDGGRTDGLRTLIFTDAGFMTVKDADWPLSNGTEIGLVWDQLVVTSPFQKTYTNSTARYDHECK
jgi:hypothetical protein